MGKGRDWVCTLYREEESRGAGIERKGDMGEREEIGHAHCTERKGGGGQV